METIFALSTAAGRAGVAVVRMSGPKAFETAQTVAHLTTLTPRQAHVVTLYDQDEPIDQAVLLAFAAPASFTGEDVVEFQCHGSRAVLTKLLNVLAHFPDCRLAEPGEFTRRAVANDKMDLTAAEGVLDLIHSDTEAQRRQALRQMGGALAQLYDGWRDALLHQLAFIEAFIDFPEEEIPETHLAEVQESIYNVITSLEAHLADNHRGERVRDGFRIAIVGAPNVGKSSLLNRLARRDAAIVSSTAGTTRDVVEVYLDIAGYPVILADTAGLRETTEAVEAEGIRRALKRIEDADLVLALGDAAAYPTLDASTQAAVANHPQALIVWNKADLTAAKGEGLFVSAATGAGLSDLESALEQAVVSRMGASAEPALTQLRHRTALEACVSHLKQALTQPEIDLKAEDIRLAARELGKITGRVEISEILDVIFSSFCIGK